MTQKIQIRVHLHMLYIHKYTSNLLKNWFSTSYYFLRTLLLTLLDANLSVFKFFHDRKSIDLFLYSELKKKNE